MRSRILRLIVDSLFGPVPSSTEDCTKKGPRQIVRLFKRDSDGCLCDSKERYSVEDFGGIVPRVDDGTVALQIGDLGFGVRPFVNQNRAIVVVESVCYRPDRPRDKMDGGWAGLVIQERPMGEEDRRFLWPTGEQDELYPA